MALIACPECSRQVSTAATACPSCGYPVAAQDSPRPRPAPVVEQWNDNGRPPLLLQARSSFWNFSWQMVLFLVLVPLAMRFVPSDWWRWGWVVPVAWAVYILFHTFYHRRSFVMRIYPDRVTIVEGFLAKEFSEFFIRDIRAIDVKQTLWERLLDIGDVTISTAASTEASEQAPGVPRPNRIRDLLISLRQQLGDD